MIAALCMVPILAAFVGIMFSPKGYLWLDMSLLAVIGFLIYPVINLIVIAALDVVSKKAIGTAAGFIGLFGYIGRTVQAKGFGWTVDHYGKIYKDLYDYSREASTLAKEFESINVLQFIPVTNN